MSEGTEAFYPETTPKAMVFKRANGENGIYRRPDKLIIGMLAALFIILGIVGWQTRELYLGLERRIQILEMRQDKMDDKLQDTRERAILKDR